MSIAHTYTMFSMSCLYTIYLHDFVTYFVYVLIYMHRLYVATMHFCMYTYEVCMYVHNTQCVKCVGC